MADKGLSVLTKIVGSSPEKFHETKARSQQLKMDPVKTDPVGQVGNEWVKNSIAESGVGFFMLGGLAGGFVGGTGLSELSPVEGLLNKIAGKTYGRIVGESGSEGWALAMVNKEATVAARFLDGTGRLRTVVATANREVWKDLSKSSAAGELGDVELLPFVKRNGEASPHPDIVVADYMKSQGADQATLASIPQTCHGCQNGIPERVPNTTLETPAKPQ